MICVRTPLRRCFSAKRQVDAAPFANPIISTQQRSVGRREQQEAIEQMPAVYSPCGKPGYTQLQVVIGPQAMRYYANLKSTFIDGISNTIAVFEATEPVIWTKPGDVMFSENELPKGYRKKFGGQFPDGFYAAMWNGLGAVRCRRGERPHARAHAHPRRRRSFWRRLVTCRSGTRLGQRLHCLRIEL